MRWSPVLPRVCTTHCWSSDCKTGLTNRILRSVQNTHSHESLYNKCVTQFAAVHANRIFYAYVWQRKRVLQGEAVSLLRSDNTVFDKALVLCQMHNFKEGVLYLYEKGKL